MIRSVLKLASALNRHMTELLKKHCLPIQRQGG